jgi:hypothetical protein
MPPAAIPNPFVYGQVLVPGRPFCARPTLEAQVLEAAQTQSRIVLVGERRMGKSSLVEHTLKNRSHLLISVDLRRLISVEDFIDRLTMQLTSALNAHRARLKNLPVPLKDALSLLEEVKLHADPLEVSARRKPKASTVIRVMNAIERASRWKKLTVFLDEFQDVVENLEERDSGHLLGVLRAEIQRHTQVAYIFAGSARGSMLDIFTGDRSHFYKSAAFLEVGPIPEVDMSKFLVEQFARGGRRVTPSTVHDIFTLAGASPNDQQQLAYHLWSQSTPGMVDREALQRAFTNVMGEIARHSETILDEATPAQRRMLFALALREGDGVAIDSLIRFSGFKAGGSVTAAIRPFLKGRCALLEKTGRRVRFRDRCVRLWLLVLLNRNPGMFPASRSLKENAEQRLLLTYIRAEHEWADGCRATMSQDMCFRAANLDS